MTSEGAPRQFHDRFDIDVGIDQAQQRFVNRIYSLIFEEMSDGTWTRRLSELGISNYELCRFVAFSLGEKRPQYFNPAVFVGDDFYRCLRVLEAIYKALLDTGVEGDLSRDIELALDVSEIDLGIDWQPPVFVRTGAPLLDENMVNEPLRWLAEPKYESVRKPFEKGLSHYLEATHRPDRLPDVITDMYEAVEALAKIVTDRDKDLSGNREVFIKSIKASDSYKQLLKDYIAYANQYRHAPKQNRPRPPLSEPEVESFIYLTGLFIRLTIRQT